jgi:hypothetical protein
VRAPEDSVDTMEQDFVVLSRIMQDAERLCRTDDPFMLGQYRHLRGRVAALIEMTRPPKTVRTATVRNAS